MKKILLSTALCAALANAGAFVGFDGGYVFEGLNNSGGTNSTIYDKNGLKGANAWNLGINFGAESFANNYFGARAFLELNYLNGLDYNKRKEIALSGNADILVNLIAGSGASFGVFGGVGIGYAYSFTGNSDYGYAPLFGRVGATLEIAKNSRIDLTFKLPIMGWHAHGSGKNFVASPMNIQVGYKYLF